MNHKQPQHQIQLKVLLEKWLVISDADDVMVTGLTVNSKMVQPGDLFFAYPGTESDGRHYIESAVQNGAVVILAEASLGVSEHLEFKTPEGVRVPMITIPNLASQCSGIAAEFFGNPSRCMQVVGITGTNGKTSCAYYLAAAFTALGVKAGLMGTLGTGVYGESLVNTGLTTADAVTIQASLASLYYSGVRFVAMEVSSHALAQGRVAGVHFDRAVYTNLSPDHLDYHHTMHDYWLAKKTLFENFNLNNAIINAKDQHGRELLLELWGMQYICGYCQEPVPEEVLNLPLVTAHDIELSRHGIRARIETPWGLGQLQTPQIGRYNLSNLLAVIATMGSMGIHIDDILHCMTHLPVVPGRMQSVVLENKPVVIIDYAHTPDALENVLAVLREHRQGKLWCVFGCGGSRDQTKRPVMGEIAERLADAVVVTDDNPRMEAAEDIVAQILAGMEQADKVVVEHDREKAIEYAIEHADANDIILVAGKGHETSQQIGKNKRHFSDLEKVQKYLR